MTSFFTSLLGRIGSFLMLVFMVVQLAGSVGTYPLEISGSFVKYLHDWVPFTYTVKAFRSAICAGQDVSGCALYLALWAAVFTLLTLVVFAVRAKHIRAGQPPRPPWLGRHRRAWDLRTNKTPRPRSARKPNGGAVCRFAAGVIPRGGGQ